MAFWRPVTGHIQILDSSLVTKDDIERFFADERIIGRGEAVDEFSYKFEVAIAGRRRRVATLDEEGGVFRGRSVGELVDEMRKVIHKVAVELDGAVLHGDIDLGSVDITDADLLYAVHEPPHTSPHTVSPGHPSSAANTENDADSPGNDVPVGEGTPVTSESTVTAETADPATMAAEDAANAAYDDDVAGEPVPELAAGPMLVIADLSMSEMPVMANIEQKPISVSTYGSSRVLVSLDSLDLNRRMFPRPAHAVALSVSHLGTENPMLIVRRDNLRQIWDWTGEHPLFKWIKPGSPAEQFGIEELGAGAIARMSVADVINAKFSDVREALLTPADDGARAFVRALGLPPVYADVLEGRADLEDLKGKIFEPKPAASTFEESFAWEMAGEGVVDSDFAKVVRETVVERPWLPGVVSVAQAAVGGGLVVRGMRRNSNGRRGRTALALGLGMCAGAVSRILTSSWVQSVVAKQENDIRSWQERDRD